jgi:hypothetical protein
MEHELATLPIAGWELRTVPALDALLITFSYLSHATQTPEEAVTDRNYILHTSQAREFAQKILAALDRVESGTSHGDGFPRH